MKTAIEYLNRNHYECYVVGGAVRSTLLHEEVHDYDLTTSALPEETELVFRGFPVIRTGMKHGTLTVVIDGEQVEITTYRKDTGYRDHRHPDSVSFSSSLKEDCARRDFTINALCYHPDEGFIDFFNGCEDLEKGIIRCIGDPDQRLNEDALRILRAVRFASRLGFRIDPQTKKALLERRETLHYVSAERIRSEFDRFLAGKGCPALLEEYLEVFAVFLPELKKLTAEEVSSLCGKLKRSPENEEIRLALILSCPAFADPDAVMRKLKYPVHTIRRVTNLISLKDMPCQTETDVRRILSRLTMEFCDYTAFAAAEHEDFPADKAEQMYRTVTERNDCCRLRDLAVDGNDILRLGFRGKIISDLLNECLNAVIEERMPNNKEALTAYIKRMTGL